MRIVAEKDVVMQKVAPGWPGCEAPHPSRQTAWFNRGARDSLACRIAQQAAVKRPRVASKHDLICGDPMAVLRYGGCEPPTLAFKPCN